MADLNTLKKKILLDIKQRAISTSKNENKKNSTLGVDKTQKDNSTLIKLPKSPRQVSRRFNISGVFKTNKEEVPTTKENTKRTQSCKVPSNHHIPISPAFKERRSKANKQVLKQQDNNSSDLEQHNSEGRESLLSLPPDWVPSSTPTRKGFTKSLKHKWDKSKFTPKRKNRPSAAYNHEDSISILIESVNNNIDISQTQATYHLEALKDNSEEQFETTSVKSQEEDCLRNEKGPSITRSLSDSSSNKTKNEEDSFEATVLLRRSSSMKSAELLKNERLTKVQRRRSDSDFTKFKKLYSKMNPLPHYSHAKKFNKTLTDNSNLYSKGYPNGHVREFPLLKTKIVEECTQEDGTVTLRNNEDIENKQRNRKVAETDRDSGVELDGSRSLTRSTSQESTECDSVVEYDGSAQADIELTPDSGLQTESTRPTTQFDFCLTRSRSTDDILKTETNREIMRRSSLQDNSTRMKKESKWDMCELIKRFEVLEWDLSPAKNIRLETLDLDNCDLDTVPNTVPEIEYYALREVQAVSLNHNHKITNADILGKLADLKAINMWGCNLERIPPTWSTLTKVQMLGLGNNRNLKHFGPMKYLTNITWLDLGGCGLKVIPDEVTHMMKLRVLALGGNPGIEIGDEISCMWDLKKLGLNDCELTAIPKTVFMLQKLTHLHLDNNNIRSIGQEIVQLKDLEELTVTGNLEISFPKLLSQCETVKCIVVDELKDLTRVSNTLRQRMKTQPAARSQLYEVQPIEA